MEDFINYLVSKGFTSKKEGHFYRLWIVNLYDFLGEQPGNRVNNDEIDRYISYISKSKMEWQVKQAQEAIRLYLYYLKRPRIKSGPIGNDIQQQWKTVVADMGSRAGSSMAW